MGKIDDDRRQRTDQARDARTEALTNAVILASNNGLRSNAVRIVAAVLAEAGRQVEAHAALLAENKAAGWKSEQAVYLKAAPIFSTWAEEFRAAGPLPSDVPNPTPLPETEVDGVTVPVIATPADVEAFLKGEVDTIGPVKPLDDPGPAIGGYVTPDRAREVRESIAAVTDTVRDAASAAASVIEKEPSMQQQPLFQVPTMVEPNYDEGHPGYVGPEQPEPVSTQPKFVVPTMVEPPTIVRRDRLTYDQFLQIAVAAPEPEHWSHSSVDSIVGCGGRYVLDKNDGGGRPMWSNVGGSAVHSFIERLERARYEQRMDAFDVELDWDAAFSAAIAEAEAAHPEFPRASWYVANRGKETEDWWRVEGLEMCRTYVFRTGNEPATDHPAPELLYPIAPWRDGSPMIEFRIEAKIAGKPFVAILDQVRHDKAGRRLIIVDPKGLALTTPLPTPTGWTTMGDVKVGDQLIGSDGKPCNVTVKSDVKRIGTYVVKFDDGSEVVCDVEHIWWTAPGNRAGREPQPIEVEEVRRTLFNPVTGQRHHRVPVAGALDLPDSDLPIDPYLLGCWIGDGKATDGSITKDRELFDILESDGHALGVEQACDSDKVVTRTVRGLQTRLREAGLLGHKQIPAAYLRGSIDQRRALLAGLMDTDGTWNTARNTAVFTTTDKALADQVAELVSSLGQRTTVTEEIAKGFGLTVTAYRVPWTPIGFNPFRLPRKADRVTVPKSQTAGRQRIIVSIEPGPDVETACVAVDSPNRTYLCGERMIPTHNSGSRKPSGPHQLVEYAHALALMIGLPDDYRIDGCYYMARTGTTVSYENLRGIEPLSGFEYRVGTAQRMRATHLYAFNPSSLCGSCGNNDRCPANGGGAGK